MQVRVLEQEQEQELVEQFAPALVSVVLPPWQE